MFGLGLSLAKIDLKMTTGGVLVPIHVGLHGKQSVGTGMVVIYFLGAYYYLMLFLAGSGDTAVIIMMML